MRQHRCSLSLSLALSLGLSPSLPLSLPLWLVLSLADWLSPSLSLSLCGSHSVFPFLAGSVWLSLYFWLVLSQALSLSLPLAPSLSPPSLSLVYVGRGGGEGGVLHSIGIFCADESLSVSNAQSCSVYLWECKTRH